MAKMMIFLTRRETMTRAAFARWWLQQHRPLAERLPGLERHSFNLLPEGAMFDAVVEQWFASEADAIACYDTPEGRAVAADSLAHVASRVRLAVEEWAFAPGGTSPPAPPTETAPDPGP